MTFGPNNGSVLVLTVLCYDFSLSFFFLILSFMCLSIQLKLENYEDRNYDFITESVYDCCCCMRILFDFLMEI
jgi:hypothetical protein